MRAREEMGVQPSEFTAAMRRFSAAVNIITTGTGDTRAGLTATAVFSLTAEPPSVAISVNHSASAYPTLMESKFFCVNTLGAGHEHIARGFAGALKGAARFEVGEWESMATGAPALRGALANFDCRVTQTFDFSTHTLFIGQVEGVRTNDMSKPLLFVDGNWATLMPATPGDIEQVDLFIRRSIELVDAAGGSHAEMHEVLEDFVMRFTQLNIAEQSLTQQHLGSSLYASPSTQARLNEFKREFDQLFQRLIRKGVDEGAFDVEDPAIASFAIIGMIVWTYKWYRPNKRLKPDDLSRLLAGMASRIVGQPAHSNGKGA